MNRSAFVSLFALAVLARVAISAQDERTLF